MQWSDISFTPSSRVLRQFAALVLIVFGGLAVWYGVVRGQVGLKPPCGGRVPAVPLGIRPRHVAEERPERLGAATASGAEGFELREAELRSGLSGGKYQSLDGALDAGDLVGPEIVDDVAGLRRHQDRSM